MMYKSKFKWQQEVLYHGYKAKILGHLQPGKYMIQYIADGNIVSDVYESELTAVESEDPMQELADQAQKLNMGY